MHFTSGRTTITNIKTDHRPIRIHTALMSSPKRSSSSAHLLQESIGFGTPFIRYIKSWFHETPRVWVMHGYKQLLAVEFSLIGNNKKSAKLWHEMVSSLWSRCWSIHINNIVYYTLYACGAGWWLRNYAMVMTSSLLVVGAMCKYVWCSGSTKGSEDITSYYCWFFLSFL